MANPVLPPLSVAIAAGTTTLVGLRPQAEPFVSSGVWSHVFKAWRAQLSLLRARSANEVGCSRLGLATGDALRELASSEFSSEIPPEPTRSVGTVTLSRPASVANQGGTIPKGFRFSLPANPTASPPVQGAAYESTEPVYVNASDTVAYVPVQASNTGTAGNIPRYQGRAGASIVLADTLPVSLSTFMVTGSDAAGGSDGATDDDLRQLCGAMAKGQWSATDAALVAGGLLDAGVKHAIVIDDPTLAQTVLRVADASWASSSMLQRRVAQALKDNWQGFGCRVSVQPIYNRQIAVRASIILTDPKFISDIAEIKAAVATALRKYFDNRKTFYLVYAESVGGIIARADDRIMNCTTAQVVDVATSAPFVNTPTQAAAERVHWYLSDDAVSLSIEAAS